ncbi:MAG: hypothetical protein H7144_07335 [Burkholderiales bacterium]|nr:hypothetical protein [Phycisphaerae bacterium]
MKLRIQGNSIRLRLTRSEVDRLVQDGSVAERTGFPGDSALAYRLRALPALRSPTAGFDGLELLVCVPIKLIETWVTTEQVSIEANIPNGTPGGLSLLIEKDFACLLPRGDDEDSFPNPAANPAANPSGEP